MKIKELSQGRRDKIVLPALVYNGALLFYLSYSRYGLGLSDEGIFVNSSLRILHGEIPYIDYQYYPPALNYILAGLFRLAGVNIIYERILLASILAAGVLMTYLLSRKLIDSPAHIVPPILYLMVPGPWHKAIIPVLFLASALLGHRYILNKGWKWAFYCGVGGGLAVYFRLDTSGFIITSLIGVVFAANVLSKSGQGYDLRGLMKDALALIAGVVLSTLPAAIFLLYMQLKSGYGGYLLQRIFGARSNMGLPFPKIEPGMLMTDPGGFFHSMLYYLPIAVLVGIAVMLVYRYIKRGLDKNDQLLFLLMLLGIFSYNQTVIRTDYAHLLQSMHIPYLLLVYLVWQLHDTNTEQRDLKPKPLRKWAMTAVLSIFTITYVSWNLAMAYPYGGTIGVVKDKTARLGLPRADVYLNPYEAENIDSLVKIIIENTSQSDPILVLPYEPMLYFLTDRRNPTRFDGIFPGTLSDKVIMEEYIDSLSAHEPVVVVYAEMKFTDKEESRLSYYARPLYEYIQDNYVLVKKVGQFQVMRKK